jgi:hypothetical protein
MTFLYLAIANLARRTCKVLNSLSARTLAIGIAARQAADPESFQASGLSPQPSLPGAITASNTLADLQKIAADCGASSLTFENDRILAIFTLKEDPREHHTHIPTSNPFHSAPSAAALRPHPAGCPT